MLCLYHFSIFGKELRNVHHQNIFIPRLRALSNIKLLPEHSMLE